MIQQQQQQQQPQAKELSPLFEIIKTDRKEEGGYGVLLHLKRRRPTSYDICWQR